MRQVFWLLAALLLAGCDGVPWNSPYPGSERTANILYDSFSERPKHLDPARAYSANEYLFIAQIYEPPLQYHYLRRPYTLVPLTATSVPEPVYYDAAGHVLPADAPATQVARAVYRVHIRQGIRYQPHPAFARDDSGRLRYARLGPRQLRGVHVLADLPHTGSRELVAEDYVYQVKRLAHPWLHSPIGGLMTRYIDGLGALARELEQAYAAVPEGRRAWIDLRRHRLPGARVIDRYTYEITLTRKYPQFVYWLAMPFFSPMPWEADRFYAQPGLAERNITLDWYPVGTGPYMLVENNPNLRMTLARNPNFRGEPYPGDGAPGDAAAGLLADAGRPMPFIDTVRFSLEKESIPAWNKFLQGYYDSSGIVAESFDQAVDIGASGEATLTARMRARGIRLLTAVTTSTYYMGFNMLDPVVGGDSERARLLRRAISIAVDYEEYISIFANGRGVPAQGPLPPGIFGYRDGPEGINPWVYRWVDGRPRRRDISEARALMAQAGYPGGRVAETGRPLVLYLDTPAAGPGTKSLFDWYRKQFARIGIELVVRATDYNRFQEKMRKGTEQLFQWGWNADYPDPENFLFLLYGPNGKVEHGGENAANYANPEFDRLFEQMRALPNGPRRQATIDRMVAIARRDAPWLWGFHPVAFSLHHGWYHNAKPNLMANNTLKYRRLDPVLRAQRRAQWNRPVLWPLAVLAAVMVAGLLPAWWLYRRRERATAL